MLAIAFLQGPLLWALPVAGLPVVLHLLFHRKSPVIPFSTLRFIRASLQQTAARRRVQKWILLACRILLLAILLWALAQPVRILARSWQGGGGTTVAAVVADTSYSMLMKQQEMSALDKANDIVGDLLREPLKDAKVAIFRAQPAPAEEPERLESASSIQAGWTPLKPQASAKPLAERASAARALLARQTADQKWLVILTDLQSREFAAPLPPPDPGTRIILFDLHPERPSSHGITSVQIKPEQPIPGVGADAWVEVTGHAGDAPFFNFKFTKLDGTELSGTSNQQANFETTGRARVRIPLPRGLPAERWLLARAELQKDDDLMWDNVRSLLVELPARRRVTFVEAPSQPNASRFIRFALDPYQDPGRPWPLEVKSSAEMTGGEQVVVWPVTQWPPEDALLKLRNFVRAGNTALLLLQPGLEASFDRLSARQKALLAELLPGPVSPALGGGTAARSGAYRPVPPAQPDPILEDLVDPTAHLDQCIVRRFVPFAATADPAVSTLLYLSPREGDSRAQSSGLYYRRTVGAGQVYTLATLPDSRYVSPPTHPLFPILLIKSCLPSAAQRDVQNVELGQALVLSNPKLAGTPELEIEGPGQTRYRVAAEAGVFTFEGTAAPGLYVWRVPGQAEAVAVGNVQLPAAEADLIYRPADSVVTPGENCIIVRSFQELQSQMARINEPEPQWTVPLMLVLVLICVEAVLGSILR